jgi:hypothetical protein
MPVFEFRRLLYTPRREFLKALAKIHSQIEYPQSLTVYNDLEEFYKWKVEVPEGAWWVDWQSFLVEGEGTSKMRPLRLGQKIQGQYLGRFQGGIFRPEPRP